METCVRDTSPARSIRRYLTLALVLVLAASPRLVGAQSTSTIVTGLIAGSDTSTLSDINTEYATQYGKPNQHRVWYNSAKNRWDALIPQKDSTNSSNHYILKDVLGSQTFTSVELEQRDHGRPDIFWDDTNHELYVLGSHETVTQFWRLSYTPTTDTYSIQVGALGKGVTVPGIVDAYSNVPATLYVSPNGMVWVGVLNANGLQMQYSADGGTTWLASPVTLNSTALLGVTTWSHFQYQGTTYVGLFASENAINTSPVPTKVYFWYIPQGADPSMSANWIDDSANIPPPVGTDYADDHVSATRDANENLYIAVKTQWGAPTDPLIKLYKRTADGTWSQYTVTQTQDTPEQTRPSVVIDELNAEIRVYTTDTLGGKGSYVKAKLDALGDLATAPRIVVFPKGTNAIFDDLISPRAPVNATSNVAVIAHNTSTRTMWDSSETISDTTPPTVSITSPTTASTYSTTSTPLSLAGTAADNVGVTQVTWTNSLGGSGTATGTTSWTVSGIALQSGTNVLTVTASDAAGNTGTATLTVTYTPPDTTPPTVTITSPTTASTYSTTSTPLSLAGTAADNVGVTQVTWTNSLGGSGTATGTTSWTVSGIALQSGTNVLTVTASDAAGNTGTATLSVTYTPGGTSPPTVSITSPTTAATYSTSTSPLSLAGTAADNVGVTQVTWTNNLGGSGTATGTTSWTVSGITLQSGTNVLTVTAWDAAGNTGTATLSVTYTPGDTTPPTVTITAPTSAATYSTSSSSVNLGGTAADNVGVTQVAWTNSVGGSGTASGTTSWTVSGIPLQSGTNVLTITAQDAAGNTGTATLTVTYTPGDTIATGLIVRSDTSTLSDINSTYYQQYGKPNQHRIWYNSAKNRWDALVPKFDSNLTSSQSNHYILTDVLGSQTFTTVELEQRDHGRPDIFWDDANHELYVLGSHETVTQFWRLSYAPITDTYSIQVGALGTGVTVPGITDAYSNLPATLYVSPNGVVWVAVLNATGGLQMQRSADGGTTWLTAPVTLNAAALEGVTTWTHFQFGGTTYVGVFASENGETAPAGAPTKVYFWYIPQDADPSVLANWTDDSANIPPPVGTEYADDHVSATRDGNENLYIAVKTQGGGPTDPLIKLYKRTPDGTWSQYTVTQTQSVPEQTRPSVILDELNGELRVYTTDTYGGTGSFVKAKLGALANLATAPRVVVFPKGTNATFDDLISPRAPVNATSNVAVIAHNTATRTMWFSSETIVATTTTPPTVSITAPTSAATYSTSTSPLSLAGTAADNVGVTQVAWTNSLGGSGTASGTTSWTVSGIALQSGTNVLTVTAQDAAGNKGTATLTVTYTPPDTTPPTVSITAPTSAATYSTSTSPLSLAGTAADNVGVTQVTWTNSLGGSGTASGTTSWAVSGIALQSGTNVLTVTAQDAAGNKGTATLTVTYTDTTPPAVIISSPTTAATYSTNTSPLNLAGTASDNVGVTQVTWTNSQGGSGTASGTTSWTVSGIALKSGTNILTVTARDAAGNKGTATLTVTYDTKAPTVSIKSPTSASTYSTNTSPLNLAGTASDNVGVTQVTWTNSQGGSGTASGTTSWTVSGIALQLGTNILTITAWDAAGNKGTDIFTVTYDTTPPVISNVQATNITTSAATILWTTDGPATSQVDYGTTPSFGQSTSLNTKLVTSHSVGLSGLKSGTTYYYRVKSRDAAGNLAVSGTFTFITH